jgi:hypothetical protein
VAADCDAFAGTTCREIGFYDRTGFCLPTCEPGSEISPDKCHERVPGLACVEDEEDAEAGVCLPLCQGDAECGGDLFCNPSTGLCASAESEGDPIGTACSADGGESGCRDECLPVYENASDDEPLYEVCAEGCTFGWACGWDDMDSAAEGICDSLSDDAEVGDLGWCRQLCRCNDDCRHPELVCLPLDPDSLDIFRRAGFCAYPLEADETGIECTGAGGAAGAAGASGASGGSAGSAGAGD